VGIAIDNQPNTNMIAQINDFPDIALATHIGSVLRRIDRNSFETNRYRYAITRFHSQLRRTLDLHTAVQINRGLTRARMRNGAMRTVVFADETGNKCGVGRLVYILGRADLLDHTVMKDGDAVRHGQ